jgi:antirestriction protein ArdC
MANWKDAEKRDNYQLATDKIIAALEAGTVPWRKPWNPDAAGCSMTPRNAVTNKKYRGMNTVFLALDGKVAQTGDPRFCTYKQAQAAGWQVKKGEKSSMAFFAQKVSVRDKDTEALKGKLIDGGKGKIEDARKEIFVYNAFAVFHAIQIDGIPPYQTPDKSQTWRRPEAVDLILKNSGADVRIGGDSAYYSPKEDYIQLPPDHAFKSPEGWSAVAMHELGHWTGGEERMNRELDTSRLSPAYAKEELRAELCSVFVGTELGLPTSGIENHASYLGGWLKNLREDKREIFRACAEAQRMADMCLGFHPEYAKEKAAEKVDVLEAEVKAEARAVSRDPELVADKKPATADLTYTDLMARVNADPALKAEVDRYQNPGEDPSHRAIEEAALEQQVFRREEAVRLVELASKADPETARPLMEQAKVHMSASAEHGETATAAVRLREAERARVVAEEARWEAEAKASPQSPSGEALSSPVTAPRAGKSGFSYFAMSAARTASTPAAQQQAAEQQQSQPTASHGRGVGQ